MQKSQAEKLEYMRGRMKTASERMGLFFLSSDEQCDAAFRWAAAWGMACRKAEARERRERKRNHIG